jgi:hypothetical protein
MLFSKNPDKVKLMDKATDRNARGTTGKRRTL